MPEENANNVPTVPSVVDLNKNKTPKTIEFIRNRFYIAIALALILFVFFIKWAYGFGWQNAWDESSYLRDTNKDKVATTSADEQGTDIKKASLGDKVTLKSGLTIQLTSATIDQAYEKEKKDQKDYYEKNSSQSAYLNSDYFKDSNLVLKITLTNNNKVISTYNPASLRLKDSEDNQYAPTFYGSADPGANIYSLNPSENTKLSSSYIVPSDQKNFKLIYENAVISFKI